MLLRAIHRYKEDLEDKEEPVVILALYPFQMTSKEIKIYPMVVYSNGNEILQDTGNNFDIVNPKSTMAATSNFKPTEKGFKFPKVEGEEDEVESVAKEEPRLEVKTESLEEMGKINKDTGLIDFGEAVDGFSTKRMF